MTTPISVGNQSFLGYLPATIIQNLITNSFDMEKDLPKHYLVYSVALFADISGFTKLSEGFSKKGRIGPEFLQFCLNRYMEQIINIIGTNGGDIFKFVGDAIMVVWPPEPDNPSFLEEACRRAIQCALTIQSKLHNHKISNDKSLSVKIGIGVGECKILLVGGQFKRCEYLCVGDAMKQACDSEGMAECGGQTIISSKVKELVEKYYTLIPAKESTEHPSNGNKFYVIDPHVQGEKLKTKSEAYLIRTRFSPSQIKEKFDLLRLFVPHVVSFYLNIEKETWSKEIRMVSIMFLNLKVDLSQIQGEEAFDRVQIIASTVQRCIYRTHGVLNKFLMDDKGSVMLNVWGIPPFSSIDDPCRAVVTGISISKELAKINYHCVIGITTGTCFSGVCGTLGNRREYSLLGEVVNLSARYMGKGKEKIGKGEIEANVLIDKNTKELIQNKIRCRYLFTSGLKGFSTEFDFYTPIEDSTYYPTQYDPFPFIRTHIVYEGTTKSQRIDRIKLLKRNNTMLGNDKKKKIFIKMMQNTIKNKGKKVFSIKGMMGTGKSLFIRSCLYDLISFDDYLSTIYLNKDDITAEEAKPTFVLCSFQSPLTYNHPMNGLSSIMRYIYLQIIKRTKLIINSFQFCDKEYYCDKIGRAIIETGNIPNIELIEEILSYETNDDIDISSHFSSDTYNKEIKDLISYNYYMRFIPKDKEKVNEKRKRDKFFEGISNKTDYSILVKFIIWLITEYKKMLSKFYSDNENKIPLIFVIEDTQCIDKITVDFMKECLETLDDYLYPFILIFSYQIPFIPLMQSKEDLMVKEDNLMEETDSSLDSMLKDENENNVASFTMNNLTDAKQIEKLIVFYLEEKVHSDYNSTLKRVDPELIELILRKSYGGIPLFIMDIVKNLIESKTYTQFLSEELDITSELRDLDDLFDWTEFKVPIRIEKICGAIIDKFSAKEIIILKYASVIGALFDTEKLLKLIPFNNIECDDLYNIIVSFEHKNIIEILYDLDPSHKRVVCKFSFPFIREILYQRMLIEQRTEIHFALCKLLQINKFRYLPQKIEVSYLERHLETSEKTIMKQIQDDDIKEMQKYSNTSRKKLNLTNLKISIVKNICEKLSNESEDLNTSAIRCGMLEKKSDGKITWESRFFVITKENICYYYTQKDYADGVVPLASFYLKDIIEIDKMEDFAIANKINLFTVTVSGWIKKGVQKPTRKYIFSCKRYEELYDIIITLKFLKVQATYSSFAGNFGIVKFPLYKKTKGKKKKFKFELDERELIGNKSTISFENSGTTIKRKSFFTLSNEALGKNNEEEKICYDAFKKLIRISIGNVLGLIQDGISGGINGCNEGEEGMKLPERLSKDINDRAFQDGKIIIEEKTETDDNIMTEYSNQKTSENNLKIYPKNSVTFIPMTFGKEKESPKVESNEKIPHVDNKLNAVKEEENKITIDMLLNNMMDNSQQGENNEGNNNGENKNNINSTYTLSKDNEFSLAYKTEESKDDKENKEENHQKMSFGDANFFNSPRKVNTAQNGNAFTLSRNELKEDTNISNQNNSLIFTEQSQEKSIESIKNNNIIINDTTPNPVNEKNYPEDIVVSKLKTLNLQIDNEEQYFLSIAKEGNIHNKEKSRNSKLSNSRSEGNLNASLLHPNSNKIDENFKNKFGKYWYVNKPGTIHNKSHISSFFSSIKK